jgi:hypothetical protein
VSLLAFLWVSLAELHWQVQVQKTLSLMLEQWMQVWKWEPKRVQGLGPEPQRLLWRN